LSLLEKKEREEDRLLDLYQYGNFAKEKLEQQADRLREEKAIIQRNLDALKNREQVLKSLKVLEEAMENFQPNQELTPEEKRQRVLLFFSGKENGIFLSEK
jgi:hypothetical protein